MITIFKQSFLLMITSQVNLFLYYFKRLPLVGKLLKDTIYRDGSLKTGATIVVFFFTLFYNFFTKAMYTGLMVFLPCILLDKGDLRFNGFVYVFFVLSFLIGSLMTSPVLEPKREAVTAVTYMRMHAGKYMLTQLLYQRIRALLCFFPSLLVFTLLAGGSFYEMLLLFAALTGSRFIGEAFQLFLLKRFHFSFAQRPFIFSVVSLLLMMIAYLPLVENFRILPLLFGISTFLLHPLTVVCFLLLGFLSLRFVLTIPSYEKAFHRIHRAGALPQLKETRRNAAFADVKLKDKDLDLSAKHSAQYAGKSGYDYLNALFFQRHRRMILKPMYLFLGGAFALLAGLLLVHFLIPDEINKSYYPILLRIFPAFVFVMYILSSYISERSTRAMFFNCDISLLRYAYYREKSTILSNFKIRLKRIALVNTIPALAYGAVMLIMGLIIDPARIAELLPIAILFIVLALFFSVHHLCMYYVFQPYTSELDVKNPYFKIINFIVYFLCYLCIRINSPPTAFVYIILVATLVYSAAALLLVFHFAPKNFKVK